MDGNLTLQGARVSLEPFASDHLHDPAYLSWLRDYEVMKTIGRPEYYDQVTFEEVAEYVQRITESDVDEFFAIRYEGAFVGTAKAGHIDREAGIADIGVMVGDRSVWRRGVASDALAVLCSHMFGAGGMRKLTCRVMANNPAMLRVFEKLGFQQEGLLRRHIPFEGRFVDLTICGCFADEFIQVGSNR